MKDAVSCLQGECNRSLISDNVCNRTLQKLSICIFVIQEFAAMKLRMNLQCLNRGEKNVFVPLECTGTPSLRLELLFPGLALRYQPKTGCFYLFCFYFCLLLIY